MHTHVQCLRWHPIVTLSHAPYLPPPQPSIPVTLDRLMIKPKPLTPGLGSTWMSQEWHRISGLWPDSAMAWMSLRQTLYLPEIPPHYLHCPLLYTQLPYHHRMESTQNNVCYIALRSLPVPLSFVGTGKMVRSVKNYRTNMKTLNNSLV